MGGVNEGPLTRESGRLDARHEHFSCPSILLQRCCRSCRAHDMGIKTDAWIGICLWHTYIWEDKAFTNAMHGISKPVLEMLHHMHSTNATEHSLACDAWIGISLCHLYISEIARHSEMPSEAWASSCCSEAVLNTHARIMCIRWMQQSILLHQRADAGKWSSALVECHDASMCVQHSLWNCACWCKFQHFAFWCILRSHALFGNTDMWLSPQWFVRWLRVISEKCGIEICLCDACLVMHRKYDLCF